MNTIDITALDTGFGETHYSAKYFEDALCVATLTASTNNNTSTMYIDKAEVDVHFRRRGLATELAKTTLASILNNSENPSIKSIWTTFENVHAIDMAHKLFNGDMVLTADEIMGTPMSHSEAMHYLSIQQEYAAQFTQSNIAIPDDLQLFVFGAINVDPLPDYMKSWQQTPIRAIG